LNILIVTQYFHPENFRINDFAQSFVERGHNITVLSSVPNYPSGSFFKGYGILRRNREDYKGIKIYRVPVIPRGSGSSFRLALNYISYVLGGLFTALFFARIKLDIIFAFEPSPITIGIPAIFIKKIKRIPLVFWVLDLWPESVVSASSLKTSIVPKILIPLVRFIYRHSDRILVSSRGFISSIAEKGIPLGKIEYYPQWAEPLFRPMAPNKDLLKDLPDDSFKIMFAGNIGESQDFPAILEAAKMLREDSNVQWIILGGGRKEPWVRNKIKEYQLEHCFHLMGSFPLESMPEFYACADVMLFSLKNEYIFSLTLPAKVQSYLACGKPVLAMINGEGAATIDEAEAGFTSNAEDPQGLVKNILLMKGLSAQDVLDMGQRSRQYYEDYFERNSLFDRAEKMFGAMIKGNPA
jgi:colanic acid biosynthesis glycosyl transferase WcaI